MLSPQATLRAQTGPTRVPSCSDVSAPSPVAHFPQYCHSSTVHGIQQERKMAPRASIMVLVLLVAFLSPSQSLALKSSPPSGACQINSGLNAGKTGTYDTKQEPGDVYCCTNQGEDCTE